MVTMIDEIFDRSYRAGRAQLNASLSHGLSRLADTVMNAFNVLNRIEYQAPWTARPRRAR
jgi:hypothetical protein